MSIFEKSCSCTVSTVGICTALQQLFNEVHVRPGPKDAFHISMVVWCKKRLGFSLNLPTVERVQINMVPTWFGNTIPSFVDFFGDLGIRAICLDMSRKFVKIQEHVKKRCEPSPQKTCSIVHLEHRTFTLRAPHFSAARCSAVRCRSPVQRDRSARFFNSLVVSMGGRPRVCCGNSFHNRIIHPSLFKTNHWQTLHIEKNPLKAGIPNAISSHYPPVECEINEVRTPAKVFQQGAEKKTVYLLRTFLPFKPIHVFGWFRPLPSLQVMVSTQSKDLSCFAKFPCKTDMCSDIAYGYISTIT